MWSLQPERSRAFRSRYFLPAPCSNIFCGSLSHTAQGTSWIRVNDELFVSRVRDVSSVILLRNPYAHRTELLRFSEHGLGNASIMVFLHYNTTYLQFVGDNNNVCMCIYNLYDVYM
jgi:hypothetical protein